VVIHTGGCHCGRVRFEVSAPAELEVSDCNCSICAKSGYLHLIVSKPQFRLLSGAEALTTYQFNTGTARHLFCSICGIKSFYVPRSHPDGYSVNARCLDPGTVRAMTIKPFNGQEWEKSMNMHMTAVPNLASTYLRLRPDVSVEALRGGEAFWQDLAGGKLGTFHNEYLVTCHSFDADWPMSEMHPNGDEVVCLLSGAGDKTIELAGSGAFVLVPRGTWHTARTRVPSQLLFITAGEGTQHRQHAR
jgi:hypothetical protein